MILCFIISGIISFISCYLLSPKIKIEENKITIQVGEVFEEPKYIAMLNDRDVTRLVQKKGTVNENKVGTYKIEYDIKYSIFEDKKIVIVDVIDQESPKIELAGGEEVTICPNKDYEEIGYTATDNYDGDLTGKVTVEQEIDKIIYRVKDSSDNQTEVIRKINKNDSEKPSISLKGNATMTILIGNTYNEPGYTATDNCDGDITDRVTVTETINTNIPGTYYITYEVADSYENEATITRTVKVISHAEDEKGVIYLTFDDGPSSTITKEVLRILKEEGIEATFFVINHSDDLNYLIKQEFDEGHTVAIHSYTHNYAYIYQSESNYFSDLEKMKSKIKQITGIDSNIIRFPGGSSNTVSKKYNKEIMTRLTKQVVEKGYHYFDWNVGSGDAGDVKSSKEVYNNVTQSLSHNRSNVVLMHDFENNYYTLNALRDIIEYGKQNGYIFKKITYDTEMVTHRVNN